MDSGADAGVDKAVLLALNDPLVHLMRNAVDHGIEPPEERERAGKPRAGRIVLSARTDGDLLAVTTPAGRAEVPAYVFPGIRDDAVGLPVGKEA